MTTLAQCVTDIVSRQPVAPGTTSRLDLWINGTTGDDANDGSTELLAVQTLARLSQLIPDLVSGELVINARGSIVLPPTITPPHPSPYVESHAKEFTNFLRINALGQRTPFVLWDGGPDRVVVADDGGSDYVSDINSIVAPTPTIGLTTAGWTPNAYRGYWAEVTSGPAAGMLALIESNTADTLNLLCGFDPYTPTDPGLGASFRIVRPSTELTSAPGDWTDFSIQQTGDGSMLQFQRMFISGGVTTTVLNGNAGLHQMRMSQIVIDAPFALYPLSFEFCFGITEIGTWMMDPADLTSGWYDFAGMGICSLTPIPLLWEYSHGHLWIGSSVIPQAAFGPCTNAPQINGSRVEALTLYDCKGHWSWVLNSAWWMPPGFEKVKIGGFRWPGVPVATEPGIQCHVSDAELYSAHIEDTTVGIMLFNSTVTLSDISGSAGNLLAGVYAHTGSHIVTPPAVNGGITPTISGNGGTVELSADGTTQLATWASILGSPVSNPEVTCKVWKPFFTPL